MVSSESLRGYGKEIFEKDKWKCQFCEFDGSEFGRWMLLSVSHIIPEHQQTEVNININDPRNLITSCRMCNGLGNLTKFVIPKKATVEQQISNVLEQKKKLIKSRRAEFYDYWLKNVKPKLST